jgi:hypothetical protein
MHRSIAQHAHLFLSGLVAVAVLMLLVCGLTWTAGLGRAVEPMYRIIGVGALLLSLLIMWVRVQRWARYFVGVCILFAANAIFALLAGHTLTYPRLITDRSLVGLELALVAALIFFSARFASRPPQSTFDSLALLLAVVGLFGTMLTEPKLWPMAGAVIVLGVAWARNKWHRNSRSAHSAQS